MMTMNSTALVLVLLALVIGALVLFTYRTARRVQAVLPPSGRWIEVPGARLHVNEQGQGPSVLLIHGLGGQIGNFTYAVSALLARHFRVITVDRPGSGYSPRDAASAADIDTQAAALAALIEQLQLGRTLVVGHSLGGAIALSLALNHPERVAGLALLAPLTHMPNQAPAAFKALTITSVWLRTLLAWTLATPVMMLGRSKTLGMIFGPEAVPDDFGTRGGGLLGLRPSQFLAAAADLQALPQHLPQMAARYGELRLPVAVLFGRQDRVLSPGENGQALVDKVPSATLELVDGGHMLPVTQAELSARFIEDAARAAGLVA